MYNERDVDVFITLKQRVLKSTSLESILPLSNDNSSSQEATIAWSIFHVDGDYIADPPSKFWVDCVCAIY